MQRFLRLLDTDWSPKHIRHTRRVLILVLVTLLIFALTFSQIHAWFCRDSHSKLKLIREMYAAPTLITIPVRNINAGNVYSLIQKYQITVKHNRDLDNVDEQNKLQTALAQSIVGRILENAKVVVQPIPINVIGSPLLDCTQNPAYKQYERRFGFDYSGCDQSMIGKINQQSSSCQCNYKKPEAMCEVQLLGSDYGNPALPLFASLLNSLVKRNLRNRTLSIFHQLFSENYTRHVGVEPDSNASTVRSTMQSGFDFSDADGAAKDSIILQKINEVLTNTNVVPNTSPFYYINRYNKDKAGGKLKRNRMMLLPLTPVDETQRLIPSNVYAEHDGVFSAGATNADLAFEISVATKHATTIKRFSYSDTITATEALANVQYTRERYEADSVFLNGWFSALCELAPTISGTHASSTNGLVSWEELQYTLRLTLHAIGAYKSSSDVALKPDIDIITKPGSGSAVERRSQCQKIANRAFSTQNVRLKYTEWSLQFMVGTSTTNTKKLFLRIPWSVPIYGVVVTSTPEVIRQYDITIHVEPAQQTGLPASIDSKFANDLSRISVWQCELEITKKYSSFDVGWQDAFPVYINRRIDIQTVPESTYPLQLFRASLEPFKITNLPPLGYTGISDIMTLNWYPRLSPTPFKAIQASTQTMPLRPAQNNTCFSKNSNTTSSGCTPSSYCDNMLDHRNAILVVEPGTDQQGLSSFFNWVLDLAPNDSGDGSRMDPSADERKMLGKQGTYKYIAESPVHLQQLVKSVKTLVLRLDEFNSVAFRQMIPTEGDTEYNASLQNPPAPTDIVAKYPEYITLLTRMYIALELLYTEYVIVGIVSPYMTIDTAVSKDTSSILLPNDKEYLYSTSTFGDRPFVRREPGQAPDINNVPQKIIQTYASLTITLRRKIDIPFMDMDKVMSLGAALGSTETMNFINPFMFETVMTMQVDNWNPYMGFSDEYQKHVADNIQKKKAAAKKKADDKKKREQQQAEQQKKIMQQEINLHKLAHEYHPADHKPFTNDLLRHMQMRHPYSIFPKHYKNAQLEEASMRDVEKPPTGK